MFKSHRCSGIRTNLVVIGRRVYITTDHILYSQVGKCLKKLHCSDIKICPNHLHQPHCRTMNTQKAVHCTSPHCALYPSRTLHKSISPSYAMPFSRLCRFSTFNTHMSAHSRHMFCKSILDMICMETEFNCR